MLYQYEYHPFIQYIFSGNTYYLGKKLRSGHPNTLFDHDQERSTFCFKSSASYWQHLYTNVKQGAEVTNVQIYFFIPGSSSCGCATADLCIQPGRTAEPELPVAWNLHHGTFFSAQERA